MVMRKEFHTYFRHTGRKDDHICYEVVIPGKPLGKDRPRMGRNGRVFTTQKTRDNEAKIAKAGVAVIYEPFEERGVTVTVECYFSNKVHSDVDNIIKSAMDGLNGVAYTDDRIVDELHGYIFYCEKGEERLVIKICGEKPKPEGTF